MLRLTPDIAKFAQQCPEARIAEEDARLLVQVPVVGFRLASRLGSIFQPGHAVFAPASMPCPDRVGSDGDHFRHLLRFVSQMQQADGNRSLSHFRMGRIVDGLLDFGKLLWAEAEVDSSAHAQPV